MVFSNLIFLYVFLPLNLLCYGLAKNIRTKNAVMLMFSLFLCLGGAEVCPVAHWHGACGLGVCATH